MEYLEAHVDDVVELIRQRVASHPDAYLLLDLPGQVELYTHGSSVPKILQQLVKVLDLRLVAIQLVDSHYCTEPANFLSAALLSTTTMLRLELPTVSILSKVDLLVNYGPLAFSLDFYTECQDLNRLLPYLQGNADQNKQEEDYDDYTTTATQDVFDYADDPDYQTARRMTRASPFFRNHAKLHQVLAEVVDDFGLLSFMPLDISSAESVGRVLARIDKSNGYIFLNDKNTNPAAQQFECAMQSETTSRNYETIADIQERLELSREHQQQKQNPDKAPI
jgi:hypothetical protein